MVNRRWHEGLWGDPALRALSQRHLKRPALSKTLCASSCSDGLLSSDSNNIARATLAT